MSETTYYQRNKEVLNERAKKNYHDNEEVLREKSRNKYRKLSNEKKKKKKMWKRLIS